MIIYIYIYIIYLFCRAIHTPDPVMRLLKLTKWYISGFYIMPKTPKKPYNPIIGESYACICKTGMPCRLCLQFLNREIRDFLYQ